MTYKRAIALFALLVGFVAQPVKAQNTKTINSKLEEVTVFLNKAQLTNTASVTVENGLSSLVITGLPAHIDAQSLSVEAKGDVLLQGVVFQNNYQKAGAQSPVIKLLQDSLEYYSDRLRIHGDQRDILTKEEALLMANHSVKGNDGLDVTLVEEMADFFRQRMTKIRMLILQEDKVIKKLSERYNAVEHQVHQFWSGHNQATGEVLITVSADRREKASFTISYMVGNAGWNAFYDLRATSTSSPIKLIYKANVYQQTGLAWQDVKLRLSSGNPAAGATKPELSTWQLSVAQPLPKPEPREGDYLSEAEKSAGLTDDWGGGEWGDEGAGSIDEAPSQTMADYTGVSESILAVEFNLRLPYTIPSDGNHHPIELQQHDLKATYQHMAVPKLDPRAFLVARINGWDEYNLLPGKVNTYFAGTFVGESFINANTTQDTLTISLGVDKNVVVSREKSKDFKSKSLFGNNIKETSGYLISIRNSKAEPVSVYIEDQVPVSANSQISVETKDLSGGKIDPVTGKVSWTVKLNPNETKKLHLKFEVKYPKGEQLTGL